MRDRSARSATSNFGKSSGEPRMLQARNRCAQRLKVFFLHFYLGSLSRTKLLHKHCRLLRVGHLLPDCRESWAGFPIKV